MKLYKGIFWFIENDLFTVKALCNSQGEIIENVILSSKSKTNFNHKIEWKRLDKETTQNKPFDYYPRGRVEFTYNKVLVAKIYLNPILCTEDIKQKIIEAFGLTKENGASKIIFIADESFHYQAKGG